jgi:hypothetical protein
MKALTTAAVLFMLGLCPATLWGQYAYPCTYGPCPDEVNVVTDCGVMPVQDQSNPTANDICGAITLCIQNHPGKHLVFPKTQAKPCLNTSGLTCTPTIDYYSSCSIVLQSTYPTGSINKGSPAPTHGTWLSGETQARWYAGPTTILFDSGNTTLNWYPWHDGTTTCGKAPSVKPGPGVVIPFDCNGCKVSDLMLLGSTDTQRVGAPAYNCWDAGLAPSQAQPQGDAHWGTDLITYGVPATSYGLGNKIYEGIGPDGILATGAAPAIENVTVNCFKRHGIAIIGDGSAEWCGAGAGSCTEQPDMWALTNVSAYDNQGAGLMVIGGDSNAGESIRQMGHYNQLGSILDLSGAADTHLDPSANYDNQSALPEGSVNGGAGSATVTATGSSGTGICWFEVAEPFPFDAMTPAWVGDSSFYAGSWVSDNGAAYRLTQVSTDGTALYYQLPPAAFNLGGACTIQPGDVVQTASSAEVFTAITQFMYPYAKACTDPVQPALGAFAGSQCATGNVWIHPYCETGSTGPLAWGPGATVMAPRTCDEPLIWNQDISHFRFGGNSGGNNYFQGGFGFDFDTLSDNPGIDATVTLGAGRMQDENMWLEFTGLDLKGQAGSRASWWALAHLNTATGYAKHTFVLQGGTLGGNIWPFLVLGNPSAGDGSVTLQQYAGKPMNLGNTDLRGGPLNIYGGVPPTGGVQFMGLQGGVAIPLATVDQNGQGIFQGGVCSGGAISQGAACVLSGPYSPLDTTHWTPPACTTSTVGYSFTCTDSTYTYCNGTTGFFWRCLPTSTFPYPPVWTPS